MSKDVVDEFVSDWGRQKAESTVYSCSSVLRRFDEEVGLKNTTKEEIYDWLDDKIEHGLKKTSANRYIQILKSFYRWYRDNLPTPVGEEELRGALEKQKRCNKIINLDRYRAADSSGKPIPRDTFIKLLEESKGNPDYYWWFILAYFGFRKKEFYTLRKEDVDLEERSLHIRGKMTKTYVERTLHFNGYVADLFAEMIEGAPDSPYIIGFETDRNFFNRRLNQYEEAVGVHIYPHQFRHLANSQFRQTLDDDILVKWIMGHATQSDMSARYSEPVEEIMRKAMTKDHWMKEWGIENGL